MNEQELIQLNEYYNIILEKYTIEHGKENSVEFEQFLKSVLFERNGIDILLNCKSQSKKFILVELVRLSNYDYLSNKCTDENREQLFIEIDNIIEDIQYMIIEYCKKSTNIDISKAKVLYKNYIQNFAASRLEAYVQTIKGTNLLNNMFTLKNLSTNIINDEDIDYFWNYLFDFCAINRIANICKITSLNRELVNEKSSLKRRDIILEIDIILSESININKNIPDYFVNLINVYHSKTCNKIADNMGQRFITGMFLNIDINNEVRILEKYLNSLCDIFEKKQNYPINLIIDQNTVFNKIYQMIKLKILPEEINIKFEDIFDKRLNRKNIKVPDMKEYDKYFLEEDEMPNEVFKKFFDDISVIGFKEGIIPIRYLEFIIKQMIFFDSKAGILKERQYFKIFEDFARNKVKVLSGEDAFVIFSYKLDEKIIGFYRSGGMIEFNSKCFYNDYRCTYNLVAIFHEIRHQMMNVSEKNSEYNHLSYMILKEEIISELDMFFYDKNYDNLYTEIDAELFAYDSTLNFLETIAINKLNTNYIAILECLRKYRNKIFESFNNGKSKIIKGQKIEDIEKYFDDVVKEVPNLINNYPILRVEYNDDGTRKSLKRILEDYIIISREKKNRLGNYDLYKYVLFTRVGADKKEYSELLEVDIPKDLSDSTKNTIEKLRHAVTNRGFDLSNQNIEGNDKKIISGILTPLDDGRY